MILPELLKLAERDDLTPLEIAALNLAIAVLGGEHAPMRVLEFRLLPRKIELLDGQLLLSR